MDDDTVTLPGRLPEQPERRRILSFGSNRKARIVLGIIALALAGLYVGLALVLGGQSIPDLEAPVSAPRSESHASAAAEPTRGATAGEPAAIPARVPADPRFAFLLLGYGGARHDGAFLTDSMMVAIADPDQKTLTLLSIPRDSWVPLLFDGKSAVYSKINTAYAYAKDPRLYTNRLARYGGKQGAGNFAVDTVSRVLGIPISNYVGLDFDGFRQMIDTVGGVDVRVPESFAALYPANDDPSIDSSWITVRFNKGVERMNGERAIRFARAREVINNANEASDFARSRRQRSIMEAFKTRLFEAGGLIHLPQIVTIMAGHVDTDYAIGAVGQLSQLLLDWKNVTIYQTSVTAANYLDVATGPEGAYILIPSAPDHTWAQIRAFARRLWQDPAAGVAMADTDIVVVNNTGTSGLAGRLTTALAQLGYRVGEPQNGTKTSESRVVDRTGGKGELLVEQLERDLGITFREISEGPAANPPELIIELGASDAGVADLVVPVDAAAASGSVGVRNFSGWYPVVATPAPTAVITHTAPITRSTQPLPTPRPGTPTGITPSPGVAHPGTTPGPQNPTPSGGSPVPTTLPSAATAKTPTPATHPPAAAAKTATSTPRPN